MYLDEKQFNDALENMKNCNDALLKMIDALHLSGINGFCNFSLFDDKLFNICLLYRRNMDVSSMISNMSYCYYQTGKALLDNDLNVSQTSVKLKVHRNTIIYRIQQLSKCVNYDVTVFANAVKLSLFFDTIESFAI